MSFNVVEPCCPQLSRHAISSITDSSHFAYTSSCHNVTVSSLKDKNKPTLLLSEEPSVLFIDGDELASANTFTFQIKIWNIQSRDTSPTAVLTGHVSPLFALQMNSKYIASTSQADIRVCTLCILVTDIIKFLLDLG